MSRLSFKKTHRRRPRPFSWPAFPQGNTFADTIQAGLRQLSPSWRACIPLATIILMIWGVAAMAQEPAADAVTPESLKISLDTMWVVIAAILVIFMNAGFGMLETGFCRQKNAVNILSKNLIVFALATLAYWVIGFTLMFSESGNPFFGIGALFLSGDAYNQGDLPKEAFFLFQAAFAGTAATIVSGAVAERIKFIAFILFSLLLTGIFYPISGHWVWGGGWLSEIGFSDFAGSTVVHSVGGWAALMGAAILGPRISRYPQGGSAVAMPGHSMSIATLGCLILWIGWFGFNPGSQLAADPEIAYIALTTNLAAAAGGVAATATAWIVSGKPDLSMIINGILAGLVGITAGCDAVALWGAVVIGLIAGVTVVMSVLFFDKIKIDDPVGAISVHLVCGIWGTLAVGLFAQETGLLYGQGLGQLGSQIIGILAIGGFTVLLSVIAWLVIKALTGLRVSPEEEIKGLDIGEHGMEAYAGFLKEEIR